MKKILAAVICLFAVFFIMPSTAQASVKHVKIVYGVNQSLWNKFKTKIPDAGGVRVYYDTPDYIPASWPSFLQDPWTVVSIRPMPGPLLSGKLDKQLDVFIDSAPPHSFLAVWHENGPANPLGYPKSVNNAVTSVKMQKYMERLVQGSNVKFGVIICAPAAQIVNWMAPHLDWYGTDFYLGPNTSNLNGSPDKAKIWKRMSANQVVFRKLSGRRYPKMIIPESNASYDKYRNAWFTDISSWFNSHNGRTTTRILTFWNPDHGGANGLSGRWPPSQAVIDKLNYLSKLY